GRGRDDRAGHRGAAARAAGAGQDRRRRAPRPADGAGILRLGHAAERPPHRQRAGRGSVHRGEPARRLRRTPRVPGQVRAMILDPLHALLFDHPLRTVALGAGMLGAVSGALGSFAVLRRQSLLGDAVSHSALPGIALAFLLTGSRAPLVLITGAAVAGWL